MRRQKVVGALAIAILSALAGSSQAHYTVCTPGPYIIFFDRGMAADGQHGPEILDNFVGNHAGCPTARIVIDGHVAAGEAEGLAIERAIGVRHYLVGKGIAGGQIYLRDLGSSEPRTYEPAISSRVELTLEAP